VLTDPPLPKSTKSHLMKVLREAGIIRNVPHGRGRQLSLRREEFDEVFPGLLDAVLGDAVLGDADLGDPVLGDADLSDSGLGDAPAG
jgi:DNA-binding transcriptional ArsR family regulator